MRLGLKFREMLTGPLQVVQDELDQLIAGILGGYRLEHKLPSGLHGNITADSINLNSGGTIGGDVQITGQTRTRVGPTLFNTGGSTGSAGEAILLPAQITANQNDYNPPGLSTASGIVITSDAARAITGMVMSPTVRTYRLLYLLNAGAFTITLNHNDVASTAGYRFSFAAAGNLAIRTGGGCMLFYSARDAAWFCLGQNA